MIAAPALQRFDYYRSVAPMIWVVVAIATVEIVVVHVLVASWRPWVAVGLSAPSIATLAWLVAAVRSFDKLPVEIADGQLVWQVGTFKRVTVNLNDIRELKSVWTGADIKSRDVLNCAIIAYPNTFVVLSRPVRVNRRLVRGLAHRLDDPVAFATAIASLVKDRA